MKQCACVALACLAVGCSRPQWPEPPAVSYTTGPLPPPENRLAVAIEAGEKRFPTGKGFVQQ